MTDNLLSPRIALEFQAQSTRELESLNTELRARVSNSTAEIRRSAQGAQLSGLLQDALVNFQTKSQQFMADLRSSPNRDYAGVPQRISEIGSEVEQEALAEILDQEVITKFKQSFQPYVINQTVQSVGASNNEQRQFSANRIMESVNELAAMALRDPISNSNYYETQISNLIGEGINTGVIDSEVGRREVNNIISQTRVKRAQEAISMDPRAALTALDENIFELMEPELRRLESLARANIVKQDNQQNSRMRAQRKAAEDLLTNYTEQLVTGISIPLDEVEELTSRLGDSPTERNLKMVLNDQSKIMEFALSNPEQRLTRLGELRRDPNFTFYSMIDRNLNIRIESDALSLGIKQGIIPEPLDFSFDRDISVQLMARGDDVRLLSEYYNHPVSILTKDETERFSERYNRGGPTEKARLLGEVFSGAGSALAQNLYESLNTKGDKNLAFYGGLVSDDSSELASTLIRGENASRPEFDRRFNRSLNLRIDSDIALIPNYVSPEYKQTIRTGIMNYYRAKVVDNQASTNRIDRSVVREAISALTRGGSIMYNGSSLEPPVKGMSSSQFSDLIDNITNEQISQLGGLAGVGEADYQMVLRNSIFRNVGPGVYHLQIKEALPDGSRDKLKYLSVKSSPISRIIGSTRFILDLGKLGLQLR